LCLLFLDLFVLRWTYRTFLPVQDWHQLPNGDYIRVINKETLLRDKATLLICYETLMKRNFLRGTRPGFDHSLKIWSIESFHG
jgi:hypothetical protein